MKVVIQRVSEAKVTINEKVKSCIKNGLLVLLGIGHDDDEKDSEWLIKKIINLRIFNDEDGVMNKSIMDVDGDVIVVSQFTLHAKTKKGNRPSYIDAAKPEVSIPIYEHFVLRMEEVLGKKVQTGEFGASMQVSLINDGPVTITMDTKDKQ
ncbi:D-tyrosyl-tRNA(Tyr) deacylase [Labilibacter sediminis]|nr:D-tyrosyl-tRNA(Tyr) deacylase [Labilibacter sediminis]